MKLKQHQLGVNECILRMCILESSQNIETNIKKSGIKIVTLNARSVKNKDHCIMDCIRTFSWDLVVITETWLTENDQNWIDASEISKYGCKIKKKQDRLKREEELHSIIEEY